MESGSKGVRCYVLPESFWNYMQGNVYLSVHSLAKFVACTIHNATPINNIV